MGIVRNSATAEGKEAAVYHLPMNWTEGTGVTADEPSLTEIASQTLVEEIPSRVVIEVNSLSGETILCDAFSLADQTLSVKLRLQKIRKLPLWQQVLTFQGEVLQHSRSEGEKPSMWRVLSETKLVQILEVIRAQASQGGLRVAGFHKVCFDRNRWGLAVGSDK